MTKSQRILWGAGFIVLPFIFSSRGSEQMREPKAYFLAVLLGIALSLSLGEKVSWTLGGGALLVYFSALFVSPFFPMTDLFIFTGALGSCLFIAEATKDDIKGSLEILELAAILCAAFGMIFQFGGNPPFMTYVPGADPRRICVFFGQHTLYGPFCVAGMASALFRDRFYRAFLLAMPIPFIDASFTYLSAGVVVGAYLVFKHGKPALIGLLAFGLITGAFLGHRMTSQDRIKTEALNDNGRFPLWKITWSIAKARPILGHGFGSFEQTFPVFQSKQLRELNHIDEEKLSPAARKILKDAEELRLRSGIFTHPHNEFMSAFYELGGLGVLSLMTLILSFFWSFYWAPKDAESWALFAITCSFIANAQGNFPFHLIPQALIPLWAFTAMTMLGKKGTLKQCQQIRLKMMSIFASKISPLMWGLFLARRRLRGLLGREDAFIEPCLTLRGMTDAGPGSKP